MKYIQITNQTHSLESPIQAKYCQSFLCQLRGLMFTQSLPKNYGLLLVQGSDSRINASIHMMFMRMDLAVVWINSTFEVVDRVLARKWKLSYVPQFPARYVLETNVSSLNDFYIGDKVAFEEIALG
ncbi:MAG: hypothetical protein C3F13_12095 [Anaerolineales bacterium]|nr:hypothetical protein [Anaerolineae bacterium]PWB52263.1 MAG: hypothetical protein C3F13_12095 [Anaerolineales bacterium]